MTFKAWMTVYKAAVDMKEMVKTRAESYEKDIELMTMAREDLDKMHLMAEKRDKAKEMYEELEDAIKQMEENIL